MLTLFDTPQELRDQGIAKVSAPEQTWLEQARRLILNYPHHEATGEDLRIFVENRLGPPHHVNAYGALIMGCVRKGILKKTGEYRQGKRKESHARANAVYTLNR